MNRFNFPRVTEAIALASLTGLVGCARDIVDVTNAGERGADAVAANLITSDLLEPTLVEVPAGTFASCALAADDEGGMLVQAFGPNFLGTIIWRNGNIVATMDHSYLWAVVDMNVRNQVIGYVETGRWEWVMWSPTVPGAGFLLASESHGLVEINDRGEVAVTIETEGRERTPWIARTQAAVLNPYRLLARPLIGGKEAENCSAAAINNRGWVVGNCWGTGEPILWKTSQPAAIRIPDRFGGAFVIDMNDAGSMVAAVGRGWAYWSSESGWIEIPATDKLALFEAVELNDRGDVLFNGMIGQMMHPAVWSQTSGFVVLGTGPWADKGTGYDITSDGRIVGCVGPGSERSGPDGEWNQGGGRAVMWQLPR
jgi:hypothetical protein